MNCPKCGTENAPDAAYCSNCGEQLIPTVQVAVERPRTSGLAIASLVLALFGGLVLPALISMILGIIALIQIAKSNGKLTGRGFAIAGIAISGLIVLIVYPVFVRARETARKYSCQNNMKELGTAISMYIGDYDDMLPSSRLYGHPTEWNKANFTKFASEHGTYPPLANDRVRSYPEVLYRYLTNKYIVWCPSDPNCGDTPNQRVSYFWKAAVDYAWFRNRRKTADFAYYAGQIILYEAGGWHWSEGDKGFQDDVSLNCLFMDGHVSVKRIRDSGYAAAEVPPGPLPRSGVGEPAWFNYDAASQKPAGKGIHWDPHVYSDNLP